MPIRVRNSNAPRTGTLFLLCLIAYAAYLIRFGYGYGWSDQEDILPYLMHLLEPGLFENDWFLQTQLNTFSVRTCFVYLLRILCLFCPVWFAVLLVYLASWMGIALGLFAVGYSITRDRLAAAGAVFVSLTLTPFWTLGGNDLAHSMLVPSMTAWAIGLWGLYFLLEKRTMSAAVLLGVATWMQALVGLQMAVISGIVLLFSLYSSSRSVLDEVPSLLRFTAVYVLAAAPALAPLFYQQFTAPALSSDASSPSLFYIMAAFRNPHHYLFHSFDKTRMMGFAGMLVIGLTASIWLRSTRSTANVRCIHGITALCAVLWVVGYLGAEIYQFLPIAKLQLFKTSVLIKAFMALSICACAAQMLPAKGYRFVDRLVFSRTWLLAAAAIVGGGVLYFIQPERFTEKIYPWNRSQAPLARVESWVDANTPRDARFSIPPSVSSFRSNARRAMVVNYKAFPYRDEDVFAWFERLSDFAPLPMPDHAGPDITARLDSAYHALTESQLVELAARYDVAYVLRQAPIEGRLTDLEIAYESNGWYLYEIARDKEFPR